MSSVPPVARERVFHEKPARNVSSAPVESVRPFGPDPAQWAEAEAMPMPVSARTA